MSGEEQVRRLVAAVITELNQQLPPGQRLDVVGEAPLYGEGGPLDSLGLVNLIVGVEEKVTATFGRTPNLADEILLAGSDNPFRTVNALVAHVTAALQAGR
ncbi:MAG: acyl carrier protein [Candidatus Latescibacterota bacterium]